MIYDDLKCSNYDIISDLLLLLIIHVKSMLINFFLKTTNGGHQVDLGPIVHKADNAIHRINHYPADEC